MSLHRNLGLDQVGGEPDLLSSNPWRFSYPNTADFNFNYYNLLQNAERTGIACNTKPQARIAIIGAGVAGLTAARELFRSGYTNIHIYEASDRIGGRTYSSPISGKESTYELGAMRMPFFSVDPQNDPIGTNSVIAYYTKCFNIETQDFPNPGSKYVEKTGIYLNRGYGPDGKYPLPKMDIWAVKEDNDPPPNESLKEVFCLWTNFAKLFTDKVKKIYNDTDQWPSFWQKIVENYWKLNFRNLVHLPSLDPTDPDAEDRMNNGDFGGLGMDQKQADLFYVIGAGDGGWGAFYDISCLFPIRTLLFGYGTRHQLIKGRFNLSCKEEEDMVKGISNSSVPRPRFRGVQTFAECLFFDRVLSTSVPNISLYEAWRSKCGIELLLNKPVRRIKKLSNGMLELRQKDDDPGERYDAVIITPPTWAIQTSFKFDDFPTNLLPFKVESSLKLSHWISSAKVFFPLKKRYWEQSNIPQMIATDTFLQGIYGYALDGISSQDAGVLLASYTWEDDANKLLPEMLDEAGKRELAKRCIKEVDRITEETLGLKMSDFVDESSDFLVFQWITQPTYRGCSKLYRARTWDENYRLLTYNQKYSQESGLYFAGEAYSVEGGWTEPAFRSGIDAALHVINNLRGEFLNGFKFKGDGAHYPEYDDWSPMSVKKISVDTANPVKSLL